jgi:hypothetical protein
MGVNISLMNLSNFVKHMKLKYNVTIIDTSQHNWVVERKNRTLIGVF